MPRDAALLALRIATLCAMAASAALVVEYRSIDPSFCAVGSGCALLRRTDLAYLWGIGVSLPEAGLILLSLSFSVSLTRHAKWAALLAIGGACIGLLLLASQIFWIKSLCWLCVVTDVSALAAGVFGFLWLRAPERPNQGLGLTTWAWVLLALLAVAAPAGWPWLKPTPAIPASIRALYVPGKVNVIEFADFECPFCRSLHQRLKGLVEPYRDRLNLVRMNMPLESHLHARGAALAEICARPSGKASLLAEFLFTAEDLSPASIRSQALRLGMDIHAFDACLSSKQANDVLEREMSILREVGFQGLPTTYIGGRRIVGAQSDDVFSDALERASRGADERGVPAWAYLVGVLCLILAILRFGLKPRPSERNGKEAAVTHTSA